MTDSLGQFVAEAPNATAMFDRELRYLAASPMWLAWFGLPACPVGRSHYEDFSPIPEAFRAAHRRGLAGATETAEDVGPPGADGRSLRVRWLVRPWRNGEGAVAGIVVSGEDVADRLDAQTVARDQARGMRQAERHLEEALDAFPGGFAIYDADDRLLVLNKAMRTLHQIGGDDVLEGVRFEDPVRAAADTGIHGEAATDRDAFVRERLERRRHPGGPTERRLADGRWLLGEERRTADGGTLVIRIDITDLKNRERELAHRNALLEATFQNMGEGIGVFDANRRLMVAHDVVVRLLDAPPELVQPGVLFEDVTRYRAERGDFGDVDVESLVGDRIAAFREQRRWRATTRGPNGRVIDTRFNPAPGGGGVVVFSDVTERADAEAGLAQRNALLEATFQNMGEGIAVFGSDHRLLTSNRNAALLVDLPPELSRPGTSFEDIARFCGERGVFGEGDAESFVRESTARFRAQRSWSRVLFLNRRPTEVRFRPLPDGGGVYVYGDISERARVEARVREEEAKFRSLVEQDVAGAAIIRADGTIGYCNRCFAAMVGTAPTEVVGRPLLDFVPEAEQPVVMRHLRSQFETGATVQVAMTLRARNRSVVDVLVNATKSTFEGHPASIAVVLDVTARNRAERDLLSAAALLAAVQDASPEGILAVDFNSRILFANRRYAEIYAIPAELLARGDNHAVRAFAAGQCADAEAFQRGVQRYYDHPDASGHDEVEFRDGRVIERTTAPFYGSKGERLGRIWFFHDISRRRKMEDSLRASEERFRMLIEESPDGIFLYDAEHDRFIATNVAAERLFGVPRAELLERGPLPFLAPQQPDGRPAGDTFAQNNRRALAGQEVTQERRIRQPSGEERICRVTLVRLPMSGLIRASLVDITGQRASEAKLAEVQRDLVGRQEAVRQRIARELHDSLGQYLAAIAIKLELLGRTAPRSAPLESGLADLKALTATVGDEVSRLAWELRPIALDDIGLEPAIRNLADTWAGRSGLAFDCHLVLNDSRLPFLVETTLYRVLQEGITNVVKHARAKTVGVIVKASRSDVLMIIEDDGIGFGGGQDGRGSTTRLGLLGIRERLAAIRGTLQIESKPGAGTTLIVRAPLDGSAAS